MKYSNYFYWAMLIVNIVFASYFTNRWISAKPTAPIIPSNLVTENHLVKAEILKLSASSKNTQVVVALMSSKAGICADNKIGDLYRATKSKKPDIKLFVEFPRNTSDQDISAFKDNLGLEVEASRMNSELDEYWELTSEKYKTPAIIILSNQNRLFASQDLSEVRRAIEAY